VRSSSPFTSSRLVSCRGHVMSRQCWYYRQGAALVGVYAMGAGLGLDCGLFGVV
jgi:hypothetical protein